MVGIQFSLVARAYTHIGGQVLFRAQRCKCFYCGQFMAKRSATRDHLRPRCTGYSLALNNVLCCRECNRKKGRREPTSRELAKARVMYAKLGAPAFAF